MVKAVAGRYLKNIVDGTIYGYSDLLARNPKVKEVTAEEAFPEKFIPAEQVGREPKVNLGEVGSADEGKPVTEADAALGAEATRGMPTGPQRGGVKPRRGLGVPRG